MTVPTFLVAGGARCGTTALAEGLREHPRVFLTVPKEPHYFAFHATGAHFTAPGDEHTVNKVSVTDRSAYLALYPDQHDYLAMGDASVSTLYFAEEALPEVKRLNPQMKLVVLLREPVARAYSAHQYLMARGLETVTDFLEAVALEEERKAAGWHHLWHYTGMSRYSRSVALMQEMFPASQVGLWFYDDLNSDYERTLSEILSFIGAPVAEGEATAVPRVNVSGQPKYKIVHQAIAAATANERLRSAVKGATTYRFRERVRRAVLSRDNGIPPAAVDALTPVFADDLAQLRPLIEGPVPAWLDEVSRR